MKLGTLRNDWIPAAAAVVHAACAKGDIALALRSLRYGSISLTCGGEGRLVCAPRDDGSYELSFPEGARLGLPWLPDPQLRRVIVWPDRFRVENGLFSISIEGPR